jgi:hypothetical protein
MSYEPIKYSFVSIFTMCVVTIRFDRIIESILHTHKHAIIFHMNVEFQSDKQKPVAHMVNFIFRSHGSLAILKSAAWAALGLKLAF